MHMVHMIFTQYDVYCAYDIHLQPRTTFATPLVSTGECSIFVIHLIVFYRIRKRENVVIRIHIYFAYSQNGGSLSFVLLIYTGGVLIK